MTLTWPWADNAPPIWLAEYQQTVRKGREMPHSNDVVSVTLRNTTVADAEHQAQQLKATDPQKSRILESAIAAAKARPGFKPNSAFSISFKLHIGKELGGQVNPAGRVGG